ncbi:V-type ATP synthase subunit I [Clostridium thermarum]|uniref:V-type ATP synthase subunit I n=1 Tax=Clostridium thermarum TaxID=1716543 RepID=UPI0013D3DCE7|nr:V-type ATP synthase subunit I [Clostridium thermarum]
MAIVKMNKFTLLAFESMRDKILEELQKFEGVEFINLQREELLEENQHLKDLDKDAVLSDYTKYEENLSKLKFAIEFLRNYVPPKSSLKAIKEGKREMTYSELKNKVESSNWLELYSEVKEKEQRIAAIDSEISKNKTEIEGLQPWSPLDVSFEDLKSTKYFSIFIGSVAKETEQPMLNELKETVGQVYTEIVNRDNKNTYFIVVAHKEKKEELLETLKRFGFSQLTVSYTASPLEVISGMEDEISALKEEKSKIVEEVKAYEDKLAIFEMAYDYYSSILLRMEAPKNFLKTGRVVAIAGWNTAESNEELERVIKEALGDNFYLAFEEVEEKDIEDVPIKLKNNLVAKNFENITEMYSMPRYNEIDPTPLLAPFYLVFFGMMVADAGYGALIFLGTLLIKALFNLDEGKKNMMDFFFWLSIPTMVFGVIFGSFFGDIIKLTPIIDPINDITKVLILSVGMGVVQIFFGLGIKAYMLIRNGDILGAIYDVASWIITLIGGGLFLGGSMIGLSAAAINGGKYAMIVGMLLIVLFSGRHIKNYGVRIGSGLYALYGITSYIGDLVSYTRLMALGLAGGQLANALNLIIRMFPGWAILILGPILFILFHIFNIFLSLLGAYVHTCRLQYVEYFSKFYEGGGRAFSPFKMINNYVQIKRD